MFERQTVDKVFGCMAISADRVSELGVELVDVYVGMTIDTEALSHVFKLVDIFFVDLVTGIARYGCVFAGELKACGRVIKLLGALGTLGELPAFVGVTLGTLLGQELGAKGFGMRAFVTVFTSFVSKMWPFVLSIPFLRRQRSVTLSTLKT